MSFRPRRGLWISLMPTLFQVLYEEGYITWADYISACPPEARPIRYRKRPRKPPGRR